MNTDEVSQLLRLSQVLTVRSRMLVTELEKAGHKMQAKDARKVSALSEEAEAKLNRILSDLLP